MTKSLEQKTLPHQIIFGSQCQTKQHLILLNGIWYHYHLTNENHHPIDPHQKYRITQINGNQLTITQQ